MDASSVLLAIVVGIVTNLLTPVFAAAATKLKHKVTASSSSFTRRRRLNELYSLISRRQKLSVLRRDQKDLIRHCTRLLFCTVVMCFFMAGNVVDFEVSWLRYVSSVIAGVFLAEVVLRVSEFRAAESDDAYLAATIVLEEKISKIAADLGFDVDVVLRLRNSYHVYMLDGTKMTESRENLRRLIAEDSPHVLMPHASIYVTALLPSIDRPIPFAIRRDLTV
jgi:hypothetical protein